MLQFGINSQFKNSNLMMSLKKVLRIALFLLTEWRKSFIISFVTLWQHSSAG